jgi:hypothetical protein
MPCAIIILDGLYDIVVETRKDEKLKRLYTIAVQLDESPEEEPDAPWNKKIFDITGELWITSTTGIFKDEATFREKFPDRRVPMRLTLRQAERQKWYDGTVYEGMRYFKKLALSEDPSLAPMSEFPESIFARPRKSKITIPSDRPQWWPIPLNDGPGFEQEFFDKAYMDHYMFIIELRLERKQTQ